MRYTLLLFFVIITNHSFSQNNVKEDPFDAIINNGYFNNYSLENFYLHTNKSVYFSREEIFFKAYVVHEEDNKPFLETTNLHVNLYDANNKLVLSELFYVDNGTSYGSIKIPEDIKTGNYTIELNTQWNRNFKEGALSPIQIFNINDTTSTLETLETIENQELDSNTKEQITEATKSNTTGYILDKSESKSKAIVAFQLKTDSKTVKAEKDKFIYALLHKKGTAKSVAPIKLIKGINTYKLNFYKNSLFKGANTITVFNKQNKILAEINYYNTPEKELDLSYNILKEANDSVSIDFKLLNIFKEANISISVLHEQTKAIDNNATITRALQASNSDNSTLTANAYNSFPYKNNTKNAPILENENGLKITGTVNSKVNNTKDYKVMLTSHINNLLLTSTITSDKKFEFNNLLIKHPSDYKLSLVNKKGEIAKGEFYIYKDFVAYKADSILKNNTAKKIIVKKTTEEENVKEEKTNNEIVNYFPKSNEIEELEEVFLKDVITKEKKRIKELTKENPFLGIAKGFSKNYIIDPEKDGNLSLKDYLSRIGGIRVTDQFGIIKIYKKRITNLQKGSGASLMNIYLDGMPMNQDEGLDVAHLNVTDFELININISGAGYGLQGANGVINLITRNDFMYKTNGNSFAKKYQTIKGFNLNQSNLNDSKLSFPNLKAQYYYKAIDWIPNYTLKPNSANVLKIKKPKNENIKLIINGFNNDGDLIHKVIDL